ncbi:thiovarsolin family RiPP [Streptomyces sp. NPDC049577]|uniref:thiovarsolin family RiPP n=1 Tax=Streptomyces sp. NPDC049577 TaxID=3155153 RepID=UPI00341CD191
MSGERARGAALSELAEMGPARLQAFLETRSGVGEAFFTAPRAQTVRGAGESFFTAPRAQSVRGAGASFFAAPRAQTVR